MDGFVKFTDNLAAPDQKNQAGFFQDIGIVQDLSLDGSGKFGFTLVGVNAVTDGGTFIFSIILIPEDFRCQTGAGHIMPQFLKVRGAKPDVMQQDTGNQNVIIYGFLFSGNHQGAMKIAHHMDKIVMKQFDSAIPAPGF